MPLLDYAKGYSVCSSPWLLPLVQKQVVWSVIGFISIVLYNLTAALSYMVAAAAVVLFIQSAILQQSRLVIYF